MEKKKIDISHKVLNSKKGVIKSPKKNEFTKSMKLENTNQDSDSILDSKILLSFDVFENFIDAHIVIDLKGNVLKMNNAAQNVFDYEIKDKRLNLVHLINKEYHNYTIKAFVKLLKKGTFKDYEGIISTKNNTLKRMHINASLIYDKKNIPIAAQGIIRDMSKAKLNAEIMNEQNEELAIIVDNSSFGVVLTQYGNILKTNPAMQNLLDYTAEEFSKLTIKDISFEEDYPQSHEFVAKMDSGEIDNFVIRKRYKKKDGSVIWAKTNVSAARDSQRQIKYQVAVVEDITTNRKKTLIVEVTNNIVKAILGKLDIYEIAWEITDNIATYLGSDDCVIYLMNKENNTIEQITAYGEKVNKNKEIIGKLVLPEGTGIVGAVAETGQGVIINDTSKDKRYIQDGLKMYSKICVPIISDGEVIGVIDSEHIQKNYFTNEHLKTIENIADLVAMQLRNAVTLREHQLAQKQLIESESRLATLILNLDDGILLEDEKRKIVLTNKKFCELFGIWTTPETLIGAACAVVAENEAKYQFKDPEQFILGLNTAIKNKKTILAEELQMKDGRVFERDYIPIFEEKKYRGHLWTFKDVTFKKQHRDSLDAQKQKYSSIIANMNLGLVEVNNEDEILMINQSFTEISGYTEDELIGKKGSDIFPEKEREERINGEPNSYEIIVKNKRGERRHWLISGAPNYDANGEIIGSIGIYLDITEFKKLEIQKENLLQKLEKYNQELQDYAHIVSHDLKSPLRSIDTLITWLNEDYIDKLDKNGRENLQLIRKNVEKMDDLINVMLEYSTIGKAQVDIYDVDLNVVMEDVFRSLYIPKRITVTLNNTMPIIKSNKYRLQQLFQNLIDNAIKNNDKNEGKIEIGASELGEFWQFYVRDNGKGIDETYFKKIFKTFQKLDNDLDSSGIGLSMVKKIVNLYGGKIWLESQLKKGTTFYFTLRK